MMEPRFPVGEDTLWFVFTEDRQLGPFVTSELATRMNKGEILENSFVWAQGFSDWIPASEIPGFAAYRMDLQSFEQAHILDKLHGSLNLPEAGFSENAGDEKTDVETWAARQAAINEKIEKAENLIAAAENTSTGSGAYSESFLSRYRYLAAIAGSLAILGAGALVSLERTNDPLTNLNLSSADRSSLKGAASQSRLFSGATAEIVLAAGSGENPRFAIGTNLEEGSKIEIRIDGVPGKMIGRVRFAMKTNLIPKNGFLITDRLKEFDGQPFRAGLYKVSVKDLSQGSLLATKTFFLGSVAGGDFESALSRYQKELKDQASMEQLELQQLLGTASKILNETSQWFTKNESRPKLEADWQARSQQFALIDAQFKSLESQWTTEPMASQIYYFDAYKSMIEMMSGIRAGYSAIGEFVINTDQGTRTANRDKVAQAWLKAQSAAELVGKKISEPLP